MAKYLPESPLFAVFVVVVSFNIVQDIIIRHDECPYQKECSSQTQS